MTSTPHIRRSVRMLAADIWAASVALAGLPATLQRRLWDMRPSAAEAALLRQALDAAAADIEAARRALESMTA